MKKKLIITAIILFFITSLFLLYARFISTSGYTIHESNVVNSKLSTNFNGLKVVHLSDIHYGRTVDLKKLSKIVTKINDIKPDIVVITGDTLDKDIELSIEEQKELGEALSKIDANLGRYIISGNHDFKHSYFENVIKYSMFTNLNNTYDVIYNGTTSPIMIAGMSSNIEDANSIETKLENYTNYLAEHEELNNVYKILLMHEPDYIDNFKYSNFDMILAGHTHNGQVRLPFVGATILPPGGEKYYTNHYLLGKTDLFISSGLGTSTINFRFMNKPSFNVYRITQK